jgi:acylglycerol lipase
LLNYQLICSEREMTSSAVPSGCCEKRDCAMNQTAKAAAAGSLVQLGPETANCSWISTTDGVRHFLRTWQGSAGKPVVVYLHGIEGHGRWFEDTALFLQAQEISVYAVDRRGAGSSQELRGHLQSQARLIADIEELLQFVYSQQTGPVFLVANCWGAKAAVVVAGRQAGENLAGLVLTSPAVDVKVDVPFLTKLRIAKSYLLGRKDLFDIPLTAEHFTDRPEYLKYIEEDPLRLKQATAAFFLESLKLTAASKAAARKLKLPVLVLQSGKDAIVEVEGIKKWFSSIAAADKTLELFPQATHSLDFDHEAARYQSVLLNWISFRAAKAAHEARKP